MLNKSFLLLLALSSMAAATLLAAGESHDASDTRMVIALSTDDFELAETDISDLAIGDSETIVTDSGKTIDLLRTEEGVEIYVDGELLEPGMHHEEGVHGKHAFVAKRAEMVCEGEEECEKTVWFSDEEELDIESLHGEGHQKKIIIIKEEAETN